MIIYPSTLPDFRMGKKREQQQTYDTTQPFAGPLYTEKLTDESPVMWEVSVICSTSVQARQFQAFVRLVSNGQPFMKDILTEEGHIEHEVKFIAMPLRPEQISQHVWVYSGVIYANKLISNDDIDVCDPELILCHLQDAEIIDCSVNDLWPGA